MFTLICGLPNAGKTTYSARYNNVVHVDEIVKQNAICDLIRANQDICVEGVCCNARYRKRLLEAYQGDKSVCIWLDTPLEECVRRENRNRSKMIINNCHRVFEPPTLDEGWDEVIRI